MITELWTTDDPPKFIGTINYPLPTQMYLVRSGVIVGKVSAVFRAVNKEEPINELVRSTD